jgi:secondary thiamine-phosphate synthase enzyme
LDQPIFLNGKPFGFRRTCHGWDRCGRSRKKVKGIHGRREKGERLAPPLAVPLQCFSKASQKHRRMYTYQQLLWLPEKKRGFHLITSDILQAMPQIGEIRTGLCQVFIQHTSASLTINENADPTVRKDFEMFFNKTVPEGDPAYQHNSEGPDDMPAHLKAAMLGSSVLIPIRNGQLALGTWQGIYLCEHRTQGGPRSLVITAMGV